jgi:hypothetical protein
MKLFAMQPQVRRPGASGKLLNMEWGDVVSSPESQDDETDRGGSGGHGGGDDKMPTKQVRIGVGRRCHKQ